MSNDNKVWVLEYSEIEHKHKRYPLHIQTKSKLDRFGPGPGNWKVIFIGTEDEVYTECEKKHKELGLE